MNSSVRINVRVLLGNAVGILKSLRDEIRRLEQSQRQFGDTSEREGRRVQGAWSRMALEGRRLTQVGRTLMYNFSFPLIAAFAALERQALKNSQSFALLRQVYSTAGGETLQFGQTTGKVVEDLRVLDQILITLSNTYGIAKDQVTELAVTFGRAGLSGVDLAKNVKNALVLMTGFQVTAAQATDSLLTIATAYKLSADEVKVASAIMTDVSQRTRADVNTLAAGFVKAAPGAALLGITVSELAGVLGVMQQAGFKGAESGTAFNFMMTRLVEATPKAVELFKQFGVELDKAAYLTASGTGRLQMLKEAMDELSDGQRAKAIASLFGVRQYPKAISLLEDLIQRQSLFNKLQMGQKDSAALVANQQNQLAIAMDNSATKFSILKTQMMNNFIVIANSLTPALLALMNMVVEASRWFARLGDTAGGRTVQALIIATGAILALIGPLAILIGSLMSLAGLLAPVGAALAAVFSPIGVAIAALVALAVIFRKQFSAVLQGLYYDVLAIAKAIYEALQWINPFAHHSPSLVERTRDGVAAILGYWSGLGPLFSLMDRASSSVQRFGATMASFTTMQNGKDLAKDRADVVAVGGKEAGVAFDAVVADNDKLLRQLPLIQSLYDKQAPVVEKASKALDAANKVLDAAQMKMDVLRAKQDAAQKSLEKLGDPAALRSQADAADQMARSLAEAGNVGLAQQFGAMAKKLTDQANAADKAQQQVDSLTGQIDAQNAAISALTIKRDLLNLTYDTENEKLQAIKDLYAQVGNQIDSNTQALTSMASAAASALSEAKKAAGGAGADGNSFAEAAGANFDVSGAKGLPPNLPPGTGGTMEEYLATLNKEMAETMGRLFPNPFRMFGNWTSDAKDKIKSLSDSLFGAEKSWKEVRTPTGMAFIEQNIPTADRIKSLFAPALEAIDFTSIAENFKKARKSIEEGVASFADKVKKPLKNFGETFRESLGFVVEMGEDIVKIVSGNLAKALDGLARWWATNGKQIGQIVGVIVAELIKFGDMVLDIATWIAKLLWPVVKFTMDAIIQVFRGAFKIIGGLFQFIIQLLTGNFGKALEGLGTALLGVKDVLWGGLKAIGGALVLGLAALLVMVANAAIAALASAGPLLLRLGTKLPGWLWKGILAVGKGVFQIGKWIADLFASAFPGLATPVGEFARKIPGLIWQGIKEGGLRIFQFGEWIALHLRWAGRSVLHAMEEFGSHMPGWIWQGLRAAWDTGFRFVEWYAHVISTWSSALVKSLGDFGASVVSNIWIGLRLAWDKVMQFVPFVVEKFAQYAPKIMEAVAAIGRNMPRHIWKGIQSTWDEAVRIVGLVAEKFALYAPRTAADVIAFGKSIPRHIWNGITAVFDKSIAMVSLIASKFRDVAIAIVPAALSLGWDLIKGIAKGIAEKSGELWNALKGALDSMWKKAVSWAKIGSPSRLFANTIGAPISQGVAMGINAEGASITDALLRQIDDARGAAASMGTLNLAPVELPALQQKVNLMYSGMLASMPALNAGVVGPEAVPLAIPSQGTTQTIDQRQTHITIDASEVKTGDPMAMASMIAWRQRTEVQP